MGMCKAVIIGHLGREPEVRYTPDGLAVTNFSVAATEKVKGVDQTQWFRVTAFGKLGEICGQYLTKGKQVYVEGRLQTNEWEDQEGKKRFGLELIANTMQMLGPRTEGPQGGGYGPPPGGGGYQGGQTPYQGGGYQGGPPPGQGYQGGQPPYQGGGYQGGPPPGQGYQGGQPPYQGGGYQGGPPPGQGYQGGQPPYQGGGYQGGPPPSGDPGYADQGGSYKQEPDNYQESPAFSSKQEEPAAPIPDTLPKPDSTPKDDALNDKSDMGGNQADNVPDDDDIPF
ncbi:single-stranded DNA-binding protein [Desulfobacterales bacterium HSG17]|nr:single-stranded DNA-binding protein [Desulfobacterales bacterium HSG17]